MYKKYLIVFILFSTQIYAQLQAQTVSKPKAVIAITVNQFYPEWMEYYKEYCTYGGLNRLTSSSSKIEGDYNYYFSQRGVDQATLFTGAYPALHGIPSTENYDYLQRKFRNIASDSQYPCVSDESTIEGASPINLQLMTLGTILRMNNPFSKAYSIGVNKEEALFSAGSGSNNAIWLDEKTGDWITSSFYGPDADLWLQSYNKLAKRDSLMKLGWMPMSAENQKNSSIRIVSKLGNSDYFFYDLLKAKRNYHTHRVLKATPHINTLAIDLASTLIKEQYIGKDNDTDLLTLNLTALDYMNRDFSIFAPEFKDLVQRLDRDLAIFFNFLDQEIGKDNYILLFTFSQARELLPEDLQAYRMPSHYFSIYKAMALLKSYLNLLYGEGEWIAAYNAAQIYLNRELILSKKISLKEIQNQIAHFLTEFEGVDKVITASALMDTGVNGMIEQRMRNSFYRKKSGDLFICMAPYWNYENNNNITTQQEYSRRSKVPIYVFGMNQRYFNIKRCKMVDLLPSLCNMINIQPPYWVEGESFINQ